jgi:hypothetical protein
LGGLGNSGQIEYLTPIRRIAAFICAVAAIESAIIGIEISGAAGSSRVGIRQIANAMGPGVIRADIHSTYGAPLD